MNEKGLLAFPEFDNVTKYLESGERTQVTEYIRNAVEQVQGDTDGLLVRNLLVWMNQHTDYANYHFRERLGKKTR